MKVLILGADNFVDAELLMTLQRLTENGHHVEIATHSRGTTNGGFGSVETVNRMFAEVDPADYGLVIMAGGNAACLNRNVPSVQALTRPYFASA